MNLSRHILFLLVGLFFYTASAFAQPGFQVNIQKPKPYQERKLKAEKTGEGKIKTAKLVLQNLTTHFNYVFNANRKLNEILDRAKEQHKDDYAKLLSFYNYDLATTAADSAQLDSVIYKARTGILNHDLRNEWSDELYLYWAAAWHLQKEFDSAALMLQFINYAYAPQYEDGYYKYIGTNADGARELSIVTKEDKKFLHNKNFSRNTAFIWRIRNLIEQGDMTRAGSLITTLRRDRAFPKRLLNPLDEVEAYWHYRQEHWDSAAVHLLATLDGEYPKLEKARWTYLVAQLLERSGKSDEAVKLYEKVAAQTPDPVMEIFARLNLVRLSKEGGEDAIDRNVAELLKMAKRDKYEDYRDIIYYMAAQMEMERNNFAAASELLIKGSKFDNGNASSRNSAFLKIADASYEQKKYLQAAAFYDSVQVADLTEAEMTRVNNRRTALEKVVINSGVVYRQDSLQKVAALPEEERTALVKSIVKKMRKAQGLKEEATVSAGNAFPGPGSGNAPEDLFSSQQKGEWYFYNQASKTQGAAQFKSTWGTRPNVDNWRRFAAVSQQSLLSPDKVDAAGPNRSQNTNQEPPADNELSVENFLKRLPTTPEALKVSNDSIRNALFDLGVAYLQDVEDYPMAISTFEELRRRFPEGGRMAETLFHLYYAYSKSGNATAAAQMKKLLSERYPTSRFTGIVLNGKDPMATVDKSAEATRAYEDVYNLFIEGKFEEAESKKRIADSTYKTTFWQPQLLYIEAVYNIRQRQDSVAMNVLQTIVRQNTNKALTTKAQNLMSVLSRRRQIEDELTRLQITRPSEDEDTVVSQPVVLQKPVEKKDTAVVSQPAPKPAVDSAALAKARQKEISDSIALSQLTAKRLKDSLDKVRRDSLALAKQQAAQALRDSLERKALVAQQRKDSIAAAKAAREQAIKDSLALAKAMRDQARDSMALSRYLEKRRVDSLARVKRDSIALAKKQAAEALRDSLARKALADKQRRDSIAAAKEARDQAIRDSLALVRAEQKRLSDSLAQAKAARDQAIKDSLALAKAMRDKARSDSIALARENARIRDSIAKMDALRSPEGYVYNPAEPHYAVVVMNNVDPIFVSEARTAFTRYNKESYADQPLDVQILNFAGETRLLLISGLPTAKAAADYAVKAKELAPTEIVPWLKGNKFTFTIISRSNLEILKSKADLPNYQKFLEQHLPVKF